MSLLTASFIGMFVIKLFSAKQDRRQEVCPAPFYGTDEYSQAFAEALSNRK